MQIPPKHLTILSNPLIAPEYLSLRHLAIALLKIIDYAEEPPIDHNEIKRIITEIQRAPEDSSVLWDALTHALSQQKEVIIHPADDEDEPEVNQTYLLTKLIDCATSGDCIRNEIEEAAESARQSTYQLVKERAAKRQEYEKLKAAMHKKRLQLTTKDETAAWQVQWNLQASKFKAKARAYEIEIIELQRAKQTRTKPVGLDTLGNTYWLFSRRSKAKPADDLGCRLIVELKAGKPHPTCKAHINGSCNTCTHPTSQVSEERIWYEIDDPEEAQQLARWIAYEAALTLDPKPKPVIKKKPNQSLAASIESAPVSEVGDVSVNDDDDLEVQIRSPPNQDLLDSWLSIESLVRKIDEFAHYLESL